MNPDHKPTEQSSVSPTTYTYTLFSAFMVLMLTLLACSCSSTTIDETDNAEENDIVVTIAGSDSYTFPSTRAANIHEGHQLRYVASLYSSSTGYVSIEGASDTHPNGNLVKRVEQVASQGNQVVFRGVEPGYYFIVVFADYIDDSATQGTDGTFPDKYYDTNSDPHCVKLLAKDASLFNNHNLDCFLYYPDDTFEKKNGTAVELTFPMKRCVGRIDVIANAGNIGAVKDVTISNYSVFDELSYQAGYASEVIVAGNKSLSLSLPTEAADANLIFFYYSFNGATSKQLLTTDFTLNPKDGYQFANEGRYSVPQLSPEANTIYKVKGNFLSTTQAPSTTTEINVTIHHDWENDSQEITN